MTMLDFFKIQKYMFRTLLKKEKYDSGRGKWTLRRSQEDDIDFKGSSR